MNSADVLYNKMMSFAKQQTLGFDALTKGGGNAVADYMSYETKHQSASI
jgi:hypothetical protein